MVMLEYMPMKEKTPTPKALSQTTFMRVIAMITPGQQGIKNSVNYCLEVLLFENIRNFLYIVEKRVTDIV